MTTWIIWGVEADSNFPVWQSTDQLWRIQRRRGEFLLFSVVTTTFNSDWDRDRLVDMSLSYVLPEGKVSSHVSLDLHPTNVPASPPFPLQTGYLSPNITFIQSSAGRDSFSSAHCDLLLFWMYISFPLLAFFEQFGHKHWLLFLLCNFLNFCCAFSIFKAYRSAWTFFEVLLGRPVCFHFTTCPSACLQF